MKVIPLAAESLGVRSMATYVEVGRTGILIDPGATLAPAGFGLPPTEDEWEALRRANDRISAYAARASFVFVSHYHEDHFRSDPASYAGRIVLAKDPRRMIGGKQAQRGEALWKALDGQARVERADGARRREAYLERDVGRDAIERAIDQLVRVMDATGCRVIMDHHALRDPGFAERFARLWETERVVTAAAHLGLDAAPLESRRNRAWAAARKPPARAPVARVRMDDRAPRRFAKGGFTD